jgi:hypothetical protein
MRDFTEAGITWRTCVASKRTWTYITPGLSSVSFFHPRLHVVRFALLCSSYTVFGVLTSCVFVDTVSGGGPLGPRGTGSGRNASQYATARGYSRKVVAMGAAAHGGVPGWGLYP